MMPSCDLVFSNIPNHLCYQTSMPIFKFHLELSENEIKPHVIITDPPYPLRLGKTAFTRSANYQNPDEKGNIEHYDKLSSADLRAFYLQTFQVLHEDGIIFTMTNEANLGLTVSSLLEAGFTIRNKIIWVKCQDFSEGMAMGRHFLNGFEYVIYASKGDVPPINNRMNVFVRTPPRNRGQNAKPEELYAHLLYMPLMSIISNGQTPIVVDGFAGSDPLTRACMNGLIPSCTTISNIYGDSYSNPAHAGKSLGGNLWNYV